MFGCSASQEKLKIGALDHFNRGNAYHEEHKFNLAIQEYQTAIALNPEESTFYYNLGLAYHSIILYERAIQSYQKAIELKPDFGQAWYNLALSLDKIDDTENAFIAYEKYQKINKIKAKPKRPPKTKPIVTFPNQTNAP